MLFTLPLCKYVKTTVFWVDGTTHIEFFTKYAESAESPVALMLVNSLFQIVNSSEFTVKTAFLPKYSTVTSGASNELMLGRVMFVPSSLIRYE